MLSHATKASPVRPLLRCVAAAAGVAATFGAVATAEAQSSTLVYFDEAGRLRHLADEAGNRISDFSHAGYRGGGVELPDVPVVKTIDPLSGDNTAHIQAAIDEVAAMPLGSDGFRGAVLLGPGSYGVAGTVHLHADGIVLRGAGDGANLGSNSTIVRIGTSDTPVVQLGGGSNNRWKAEVPETRSDITSSYVQVGSKAFEVADPEKYAAGDNIIIFHPCTEEWLQSIDYGATDSEPPWPVGGYPLVFNRLITKIVGDMVHIDAPVFNHLDRSLSQSYIYKPERGGTVANVGLENVRVGTNNEEVVNGIMFMQVEDAWVRDTTVLHFLLGGVRLGTAKHVTVRNVRAIDPKGPTVGGRKYNFMAAGAQLVLIEDSYARGGRHSFASNGTSWDSGIVFLRGTAEGSLSPSEGHHRWSMGLLYDGHTEVAPAYSGILLGLYNRGSYGSGHGWATANSVAWNCDLAGGYGSIQQPPGAQNYGIGCKGQISGQGPFNHPTGHLESIGEHVQPLSLYEAQLSDRLAHPPDDGEPPAGFQYEIVHPQADAYVRGGPHAGTNYGTEPVLAVKTGNPEFTREVYLRFDVGSIQDFEQVRLRLRQPGLGFGGMRFELAASDPTWDEAEISYDNRPAAEAELALWFPEQADDSLVDVTEVVQSAIAEGRPVSFRVRATDYFGPKGQATFGSREGDEALRPALVYTVPAPEDPTTGAGGQDGGSAADVPEAGCGCTFAARHARGLWLLPFGVLVALRRRLRPEHG